MTASYFTLAKKDQQEFTKWLNSLPIPLRAGYKELLWLRSKGKKAILWTSNGFRFFDT